MYKKAKLSSKYQLVIPKELRQYAHLKSGDKVVMGGFMGRVIISPQPRSYTDYMQGLHKNVWAEVNVDQYIKELREGWKRN